jgi:hypothetical protein
MPHDLAKFFSDVIEREVVALRACPEQDVTRKPGPDRWSQCEELGHLIDSATNNHARFVCAALQGEYTGPSYAQNGWVELHAYNEQNWRELVEFWFRSNQMLVHVVSRVPDQKMTTPCKVGAGEPVSLHYLIEDYVIHMQHHLDHILHREKITPYPRVAATVV